MSKDYEAVKAVKTAAEVAFEKAAKELDDFVNQFPKGPMNLTPDVVRAMPEYKVLRAASEKAFQNLRSINGFFTKNFKKEYAAERKAKYEAGCALGAKFIAEQKAKAGGG